MHVDMKLAKILNPITICILGIKITFNQPVKPTITSNAKSSLTHMYHVTIKLSSHFFYCVGVCEPLRV